MNATASATSELGAEPVRPSYGLYAYQRQVLADVICALSSPGRRAVAHLPTGAGKTRIATHAACYLLNLTDEPKSLVVWLASTQELCEQAADDLERGWKHLGRRAAHVHRHWGGGSLDLRGLKSGFFVTGLAKLFAAAARDNTLLGHLSTHTSAVVFDEAHQAVAPTYSFVVEQLCGSRPPLLGLTATPGRTAELGEADYRLAEMFNRTRVSIDPKGYGNAVTYLIANQYLANPRFVPIDFAATVSISHPRPGEDYSSGDLDRLGADDIRTGVIIRTAERAVRRHPRTIVFCPSVRSALECRAALESKGVATSVVTADTPKDERQRAVEEFKSSETRRMVMFNYGVLTAGFDAPRTRCVVIGRPTTSLVLYSQMAGRALRGPRAGGNRTAEIFTVADTNLPGFGSVTEAFTNWEALWENG